MSLKVGDEVIVTPAWGVYARPANNESTPYTVGDVFKITHIVDAGNGRMGALNKDISDCWYVDVTYLDFHIPEKVKNSKLFAAMK